MRPRNTNGFGPFRPPGGDIRGWVGQSGKRVRQSIIVLPVRVLEHGHPLQSRVAHPLFTRLSFTGRAGSPGNWRGALYRCFTSRELPWTSNPVTVCVNSPPQLDSTATQIATFNIGCRITAIAWSPRTVSPSFSDDWSLESVHVTVCGDLNPTSRHIRQIG